MARTGSSKESKGSGHNSHSRPNSNSGSTTNHHNPGDEHETSASVEILVDGPYNRGRHGSTTAHHHHHPSSSRLDLLLFSLSLSLSYVRHTLSNLCPKPIVSATSNHQTCTLLSYLQSFILLVIHYPSIQFNA